MHDPDRTSSPFPLILRSQDGDGGYVVVETSLFRIGRRPENDLRIRHPGVSGHHAEIRAEGEGYSLADRDSTNGTFVNGVRITDPTPLRTGDIIHIGGVGFRVVPEIEYSPESASRTISGIVPASDSSSAPTYIFQCSVTGSSSRLTSRNGSATKLAVRIAWSRNT